MADALIDETSVARVATGWRRDCGPVTMCPASKPSQRVDVVLPLCVAFEESGELPRLDDSTALGARSTALGARSTALGAALTAPRAELTAPREASTAPPSGGASALLRRSVVWARAKPDSARTNAAAVVIVLTEFIGLDLSVAAHHGQPGASDRVPRGGRGAAARFAGRRRAAGPQTAPKSSRLGAAGGSATMAAGEALARAGLTQRRSIRNQ
jgi:hypothetical protein